MLCPSKRHSCIIRKLGTLDTRGFFLLPLPFLGEDFGCEIYVSGCVIVLNIILTPTSILASDPIRLPADATDPRLVPEHASSLLPPQHPEELSPLLLRFAYGATEI